VRNSTAAVVLVVSAVLGVAVGVLGVRRQRMQEATAGRERAAAARLADVARCLTLLDWTLLPTAEGGAVVRATVLPGRDGRVALDAHGGRGAEDVLVPELQTERLVPAVVHGSVPVLLERRLRRVRTGEVEELALRFSCRPPGPQGTFGVIEYNSTTVAEAPDGYGGLVRPLPPAAR
jgi:hypothetical protein